MTKLRSRTPSIDIRQVHYFMMLAQYGTISKAADALGLAQPSLSEHIARLEHKLNTKLAIRGPRGITLTEAGRLLVQEGQVLIDAAENLANGLRSLGDEMVGSISIALPPSLSKLLGIPLAETLHLEAPGIRMRITEGLTGHILDWVDQEIVDIGLVYTSPPSAGFQSKPVLREEIFLISAYDNVPVGRDETGEYVIDASQLGTLPMVLPSLPHTARREIDRYAKSAGVDLNVVLEIDSLSQIMEMVSRASAYSLLPHVPVADAVDAGKLVMVRIANPTCIRTTYLTRKRSRSASMASLKVENIINQILSEQVEKYDLHAEIVTETPGVH